VAVDGDGDQNPSCSPRPKRKLGRVSRSGDNSQPIQRGFYRRFAQPTIWVESRPSTLACAVMAERTRIFTQLSSPLLIPPNTLIARSRASSVGLIDPNDFGGPQWDVVMLEQREGQPVLAAIEHMMRFADHHGVVALIGVQ
jgi:hypothetical protein